MQRDKKKQIALMTLAIAVNASLILGVVFAVLSAFNDARQVSFSQNIENVCTLTDASANKVELEINHNAQELRTVAAYINGYNAVGMTEAELRAYFAAYYAGQGNYNWQLVDNVTNGLSGTNNGFDATVLTSGESCCYRVQPYPELAKIFGTAAEETLDTLHYTSEFTDSSSALAKSFAVTTTVRLRAEDGFQYKTLMMLITSDYINQMIASNNNVDTLSFFDYSNIVVDNDGNYVISNSAFQGTNFIDYIKLYNDDFTADLQTTLRERLNSEDYVDVLYYQNSRGQDCAFTIVPVQNSDWHILSIVPLASFHNAYDFTRNFLTFGVPFAALFAVDIVFVLLINRRLRTKTKEAEAANQSKSQFLSSMSHDIRTPMNAIIGMTVIAEKELEAAQIDRMVVRDCVKSIKLSGNHLMTLINDILDISKIESGKILLHPQDFSISETLGRVIDICRSEVREKDCVLQAHIRGVSHEFVTGDALRINQIFINILTNAVKYTTAGGSITVDLFEEPLPDRSDMARFIYRVEDTGIGMTPEFLNSIFDRFTRAVDTRINSVQGTGLGMAIVKQLVELMGGTITVQSTLNVGSVFTVTLDLPIVPEKICTARCEQVRILLIDDDPILLETVKQTLEEAGAAVDVAGGGRRGVDMATERHQSGADYMVIFVDWRMSQMAGGETIRALRRALGDGVRILVITAYNIAEIEGEARSCGADACVTKPLFKSKLLAAVESALSGTAPVSETDTASFRGLRVLVAEDNEVNWRVIHKLLTFYGIDEVVRAENGKVAFERLRDSETVFDLVLMDIQMPVMNGYRATELIRALPDPQRAATPIYAMTADAFADDIKRCAAAGMNGHLPKPIEINRLVETLREVYGKRGQTGRPD